MSNVSNPIFDPTCPDGGQFYACGNGAKFVGCCGRDPCNDAGCAAGDLRTMSFNASYWGTPQMPDQQCAIAGQQWWSCAATDPPFLGCCSINPCTSGCPQANLVQGTLSSVASIANAYDPQPPLSSSGGNTTTTTTTSNTQNSGLSTGLIIGISCAAAAVVLISAALIWWLVRRSRQRQRPNSALKPMLAGYKSYQHEKNNYYQDTPSIASYSSNQNTPVPPYAFQTRNQYPQHSPVVHEADPANQIHLSPAFTSPGSPYNNQRYSSTTAKSMSPYFPQPPSELDGDTSTSSPLKGLGVQSPVELGDSIRGTDGSHDDRISSRR